MPLSSVVGAQSIVKPGVCTSSTRPASPYDGQVIYETDTDRTLVYNGTGWVFLSTSRANPVGLDLIKTQTIGTAVSSVTVNDAFSSTYDNYKIVISGGVGSVSSIFSMILGASTASYYTAMLYAAYNNSPAADSVSNGAKWFNIGNIDTTGISLMMDINNPFLAKNTSFTCGVSRTNYGGQTNGLHAVASSFTGFTLTPDNGTITGGTIRVYGYVNS